MNGGILKRSKPDPTGVSIFEHFFLQRRFLVEENDIFFTGDAAGALSRQRFQSVVSGSFRWKREESDRLRVSLRLFTDILLQLSFTKGGAVTVHTVKGFAVAMVTLWAIGCDKNMTNPASALETETGGGEAVVYLP